MGLIPGLGISTGGGKWQLIQYSCLKNSHGRRSLASYSPWGRKESDSTEQLMYIHNLKISKLPCGFLISFSFYPFPSDPGIICSVYQQFIFWVWFSHFMIPYFLLILLSNWKLEIWMFQFLSSWECFSYKVHATPRAIVLCCAPPCLTL